MGSLVLIAGAITASAVAAAADRDAREKSQPAATTPAKVELGGGDGNGCDRALVIRGSTGSRDILASEVAWLNARYPQYRFRDTTVATRGGRTFEEIAFETATGEKKAVCFDITDGFGKF